MSARMGYLGLGLGVGLLLGSLAACAHRGKAEAPPEPAPSQGPGVTAGDIQRTPSVPIEQLLMAKVPGVWITRTPDGSIAIRIRGNTSIQGTNEPLYVVDGVPVTAGPGGGLTGINPYEIDSIQVLTDATATSMYGSRGANGVIVIKMKRPGQ